MYILEMVAGLVMLETADANAAVNMPDKETVKACK
jgi:hypothetical protein